MEEHEEQTCEGLAVLVADTSDNLATKFHHELGLRPTETVLLT